MATSDISSSRENFRSHLAERRLRVTNQRLAIFDAAFCSEDHFTAEDLLDRSRKIDHTVSRATVYRTLPILTECGLVREVDIGKDYKFYYTPRAEEPTQAQVICTDCEKIFETDAPFLEWYGQSVAQKLGLSVRTQRLQVSANCERLKENGICENQT
ncbi:MAG: Fur family transcriptional regulator [Verrucomicrobia bacterium]|nr:Fur family transcriptional regulator [Verrucomicrobiota bacterium]